MSDPFEGRWQLKCSGPQFARVREDPRFGAAIRLGRAVNSVRFCQHLLLQEGDEQFPVTQRMRIGALFYVGALLFEAVEFAKTTGEYLRDYASFQNSFVPLFRDRKASQFLSQRLRAIRNRGVFHFSDEAIAAAPRKLSDDPVLFSVGEGRRSGWVYHFLSDWAVLHAAFDVPPDPEAAWQAIREQIAEVARLSARFTDAADQVIAEVLQDLGFEVDVVVPGNDA